MSSTTSWIVRVLRFAADSLGTEHLPARRHVEYAIVELLGTGPAMRDRKLPPPSRRAARPARERLRLVCHEGRRDSRS